MKMWIDSKNPKLSLSKAWAGIRWYVWLTKSKFSYGYTGASCDGAVLHIFQVTWPLHLHPFLLFQHFLPTHPLLSLDAWAQDLYSRGSCTAQQRWGQRLLDHYWLWRWAGLFFKLFLLTCSDNTSLSSLHCFFSWTGSSLGCLKFRRIAPGWCFSLLGVRRQGCYRCLLWLAPSGGACQVRTPFKDRCHWKWKAANWDTCSWCHFQSTIRWTELLDGL